MTYLLFFLALLAAVGAAVLWRLDARQRADKPVEAEAPEQGAPEQVAPEPEPEPEAAEVEEAAVGEEVGVDTPAPRARPTGLQLPGAMRRERKAWAEAHGFAFAKRNDVLAEEWSRGAAASGVPPRDIVSGLAYGHELFVMDLGGVSVMAMRTGETSDVVVDMRRTGSDDLADGGDDLLKVLDTQGFSLYATDAGVGERFVEERVETALGALPASVRAVWLESEWVLAELGQTHGPEDWDALTAPLALLADAARVLPPRHQDVAWDPAEFTPPRPLAPPPSRAPLEVVASSPHADFNAPPPVVVRPEEPLEMPTRSVAQSRGTVPPRPVGADEVEAIADGQVREPDSSRARMPRRFESGPSIFDDTTGELDG